MSDWGFVCECCGWLLEEVMAMVWWCERCHWSEYELQTDEGRELRWEVHQETCKEAA